MLVTGKEGKVMPSWFDYYSSDIATRREDEDGLFKSVKQVNQLISNEQSECNIPPERIVIGGLSQGGAVSLLTAITIQKPIAGVFALSSYVPLRSKTPEMVTSFAKEVPIFWGHGKRDERVDYKFALECAEGLASDLGIPFQHYTKFRMSWEELGNTSPRQLRFCSYGKLRHWVNERELEELLLWVSFVLPV